MLPCGGERGKGSVGETTGSLCPLALQLCFVGSESSIPDLFNLCALVLFWQTMFTAELEAAVWAFAYEVDSCVFALPLCASAVLATLFGTTTETEDQMKCGFLLDVVI